MCKCADGRTLNGVTVTPKHRFINNNKNSMYAGVSVAVTVTEQDREPFDASFHATFCPFCGTKYPQFMHDGWDNETPTE